MSNDVRYCEECGLSNEVTVVIRWNLYVPDPSYEKTKRKCVGIKCLCSDCTDAYEQDNPDYILKYKLK